MLSLHTKVAFVASVLLNAAVVFMAFIAVDRNELPTLAVAIVPWCVAAWGLTAVCTILDSCRDIAAFYRK